MDGLALDPLHFGDFGHAKTFGLSQYLGDFWAGQDECIVIFRGAEKPENIDWNTIIDGRVGSGNIALDSPPHELEKAYFYGARQISKFGRMELNMQNILRFRRLSDGTQESDIPDHVTNLRAMTKADGIIQVTFSHYVNKGTTPVKFNLYYDQGLGKNLIRTDGLNPDPQCALYLPYDSDTNDKSLAQISCGAGTGCLVTNSVYKWGGGSLSVYGPYGPGAYLYSMSDWANFGKDDFTLEGWVRSESTSTDFIMMKLSLGANDYILWEIDGNVQFGTMTFKFSHEGSFVTIQSNAGTVQVGADTWYHLAVTRSGNVFKLFWNGTLIKTATQTERLPSFPPLGAGGNLLNGPDHDMWIDDFRVLKGVAKYTDDYTVPTLAHGCKLGEVTLYRGDGVYSFDTPVLPDGQYWIAVQAEDTDGNEDRYVIPVLGIADGTGHDVVTDHESETVMI